jgi:hypothetical protein
MERLNPVLKLLISLNQLNTARVNQKEVITPSTEKRCRDHQHIHQETISTSISLKFTTEKIILFTLFVTQIELLACKTNFHTICTKKQ